MNNAETVELLYDRERRVMALRAADDSSPHAYAVRNSSKRGPGQAIVSATAFTQHYGIDTTATRRWKPFVDDGMLCVDLTEAGTVITGNRTKPVEPSDVVEAINSNTAEDPSEALAKDTTNHA